MIKNNVLPLKIFLILSCLCIFNCQKPTEHETEKDIIPPEIMIVQPADGDTIRASVYIKAVATDNKTVKEVNFFIDGEQIGRITSSPFKINWNVTFWADDKIHKISANAIDESENIGNSDTVSVIVSKSAMTFPVIVSPNGETIRDKNRILLVWNLFLDAKEYLVEVSSDLEFSNIVFSKVTEDTSITTNPLNMDNYFWRVKAQNNKGLWSEWSEKGWFKLKGPNVPSIIIPKDQTVFAEENTVKQITWGSVKFAVKYEIEISSLPDFLELEYLESSVDTNLTNVILSQGWHFLRIKAQNIVGFSSEWSNIYSFHTGIIPGLDFGRGRGFYVQNTNDEGYILTGFVDIPLSSVLIKVDKNGIEQWRTILDTGKGFYVQKTNDNGYILTGGSNGVLLIKVDNTGNKEWSKLFTFESGNHAGHCVLQTSDGGYVVTGREGAGSWSTFLLKTDSMGNEQWIRFYFEGGAEGYTVLQNTEKGFVISGGGGNGTFIIITDSLGIELEDKILIHDRSVAYSMQRTFDNGFVLTGEYNQNVPLIKTNSTGNLEWIKLFGDGYGSYVNKTLDSGYIILDGEWHHPGTRLLKTDNNGILEWSKFYGVNRVYAKCIQQTSNGDFIIVGWGEIDGKNGDQILLIKTDSEGNIIF